MQFRSAVPSHLVKKPCRKCRVPTPALKNGEIQQFPICSPCSKEMEKEFSLARLAANRQARTKAHR